VFNDEQYCDDCGDYGCSGDICNECGGCDCPEAACPGYVAHYSGTDL
jgi:hypothetical protein